MSQPNVVWEQLRPYLQAFRTQYKLWVTPTVGFTLIAMVYALIMPRNWRASQAILVRDEAIGNQNRQGQFDSIDRMKVFQETVLEVARNRAVVESVLRKVGPPANHRGKNWPGDSDISSFQRAIEIDAPKGAEFGRTEIFFLSVTAPTREAAIARTKVLCDELDVHLAKLRDARAQSITKELTRTLQLAQADLEQATARLEAMEREVGPDLGELRVLNELGSGDSNLRTALNQVKAELRQTESNQESLQQLHALLSSTDASADKLLATPSRLLDSQPALKRLKDGLVDAQLRCAELRGRMSDEHPTVMAAKRTEKEIRQNLHNEIKTALKGVEADLAANKAQAVRLAEQQAELQKRMDRLASLRARYSNLVDDVRQRTEIVDKVKNDLSDARASSSVAGSSSLLTRFHEPTTGDRPVGPGRSTVVAGSMLGGFSIGAGLVFLFMPMGPNGTARRWNDYVNAGRRATDRFFGRRAEDRAVMQNGQFGTSFPINGRIVGKRMGDLPPQPAQAPRVGRREGDLPVIQNVTASFPEVERRQGGGRRADDRT